MSPGEKEKYLSAFTSFFASASALLQSLQMIVFSYADKANEIF